MSVFPAISLQNNMQFKLIAPKRGKVKHTPNYTAYNKTTLSSIPRNIEVILVKDANISQANSFVKEHSSMMKLKPKKREDKEAAHASSSAIMPEHISKKGYGNGFASNMSRFDISNEYKAKYSPGPGEYNNNLGHSQSNERYKSLFSKKSGYKGIAKEENPGPGFYNPSTLFHAADNNIGNSFKSRNIRFKELKKEKIGPGYYRNSSSMRWDSKLPSSCFKQFSQKNSQQNNPIDKYIDKRVIGSDVKPGPGYYHIEREFSQIEQSSVKKASNSSSMPSLFNNDCPKLIPDELKEINNLIKDEQMHRNSSNNTLEINTKFDPFHLRKSAWKKEIRSPFLSKTKKCSIYDNAANHNPGPCYYQQTSSLQQSFMRKHKPNPKH